MTDDDHDRSRVFGLRGAFFTLGMIYAFGGMQYVMNAPDPRAAAGPVVAVVVALGILSPYLMKYILKRPDLIGVRPAIFVVFSVASIPVWARLMRSYGKRNVWLLAMLLFVFTFGPPRRPREPPRANPTDPILSRLANPGLILPIHDVERERSLFCLCSCAKHVSAPRD